MSTISFFSSEITLCVLTETSSSRSGVCMDNKAINEQNSVQKAEAAIIASRRGQLSRVNDRTSRVQRIICELPLANQKTLETRHLISRNLEESRDSVANITHCGELKWCVSLRSSTAVLYAFRHNDERTKKTANYGSICCNLNRNCYEKNRCHRHRHAVTARKPMRFQTPLSSIHGCEPIE